MSMSSSLPMTRVLAAPWPTNGAMLMPVPLLFT